jgi:hypothetical protein
MLAMIFSAPPQRSQRSISPEHALQALRPAHRDVLRHCATIG